MSEGMWLCHKIEYLVASQCASRTATSATAGGCPTVVCLQDRLRCGVYMLSLGVTPLCLGTLPVPVVLE